jgi:septal ring factor EnvC (AmiA/AmiB activator)
MKNIFFLLIGACLVMLFPFVASAQSPIAKKAQALSTAQLSQLNTGYEQLQKDLQTLKQQQIHLSNQAAAYNDLLKRVTTEVQSLEKGLNSVNEKTSSGSSPVSSSSDGSSSLMQATQGMQEMQMSFNMQYLQLQNSMQNDNRQFTMVSNIMKTKHDTAKSTISNVH